MLLSNTGNGVTTKPVQDSAQILQQSNNNGATELHGVMSSMESDQEVTQQPVVHPDDLCQDEIVKGSNKPYRTNGKFCRAKRCNEHPQCTCS